MARKPSNRRRKSPYRFGIGEWFGHSFVNLSAKQRRQFSKIALHQTKANAPPCPFKPGQQNCTKKGGICSLRLYEPKENGEATALVGPEGDLRATCPHRFKQDNTVYSSIGEAILGTTQPVVIGEVRFLQRQVEVEKISGEPVQEDTDKETGAGKEDVGNIDNVLVDPENRQNWCALEIQAVYFSGKGMGDLFRHIEAFSGALPFPDKARRPDYRSSGPKRLMPQLQIKVPTLRRWGKKMAVVVDAAWFRANVIGVETVSHLSNCDIAWFIVRFNESTDPAKIQIDKPELQTLERAVEGLTGGYPVTLPEFEAKMTEKAQRKKR